MLKQKEQKVNHHPPLALGRRLARKAQKVSVIQEGARSMTKLRDPMDGSAFRGDRTCEQTGIAGRADAHDTGRGPPS